MTTSTTLSTSQRIAVLVRVCDALSANRRDEAASIIAAEYPLDPQWVRPRTVNLAAAADLAEAPAPHSAIAFSRSGPQRDLAVFIRDGFIDRYTGAPVVFIPALHVISAELPAVFPRHQNWKVGFCHQAYWEVAASVDHWNPFANSEDLSNIVTANEITNEFKGRRSAAQMGWGLCPGGNIAEWDGLLRWFVAYVAPRRARFADLNAVAKWFARAREALQFVPVRRRLA